MTEPVTRSMWSSLVNKCLEKVQDQWPSPPAAEVPSPEGNTVSGLLYSGNIHETVPKRLLLDNRLTPLERNCWQVFRLLLDKEGFAVPRYQDLQPYLSMVPYGEMASKETVARVIAILRLTRWLSLVSKGRDASTGQIKGSLYILHDEPISPVEAVEIDRNYIEFVDKSIKHANKSVRTVANEALKELHNDSSAALKTRLAILAERINLQSLSAEQPKSEPSKNAPVRNKNNPSSESEPSQNSLVRNKNKPSSDSEPSLQVTNSNSVRNPNQDSTSTVLNTYISTSTVLDHPDLKRSSTQEQTNLLNLLNELNPEIQQQVLAEFTQRCATGTIKKPIGYLFGLLRKAKSNDFKPWAGQTTMIKKQTITDHQPQHKAQAHRLYRRDPSKPIDENVQNQLAELKRSFMKD